MPYNIVVSTAEDIVGVVDAVLDYRRQNDVYDFQDKIVDLIQTKYKDFK